MVTNFLDMYERLRRLPFPRIGRYVGDFPLYDSLLAGCASRAAKGMQVAATEVPELDEATERQVELLRRKERLTRDERAFLEYLDLLDQIRQLLLDA